MVVGTPTPLLIDITSFTALGSTGYEPGAFPFLFPLTNLSTMSSIIRVDSVALVVKLSGSNYKTWLVQIRLLLEQRHAWRVVSDNRPAEPSLWDQYLLWEAVGVCSAD